MSIRLNGSTSGFTEIDAPAVAGSNTLVLPTGNGSDGNILGTDGAGNLSWVGGRMVLETAQATTSGTSVDFTGIPSWVKKITVMFSGVSTNGTANLLIQLGDSGGIETTGYLGSSSSIGTTAASTNYTAGFGSNSGNAANVSHGSFVITLFGSNTWTIAGLVARSNSATTLTTAGSKNLSGTLTQLRITTSNGTDTFDAGSINILYEG
jgi:hypothetical protein